MSLSKKYSKSLDFKWALRFRTIHPDGNNYNGIVTHITRKFIVLREMQELAFNGVVILPKRVLRGCRDSKFEKCYNQILRHTGNIKQARSPKWLNACNTLTDVIEQLKKRDIWPIVEIIFKLKRKLVSDFYIGQIKKIEDDGFWIRPYDAAGEWEDKYFLEFNEIFKIEFDDSYSNNFNDYMRSVKKRVKTTE